MAPIDPWRNNSTSVFGALAFCTTNIEDFRTHLTSMSSTISATYSLQKRSLRWTSSKRKIMDVIEVDQLEDTNNKRLSWAMPHSGLKIKNKKIKKKNKKIHPPKNLVLPPTSIHVQRPYVAFCAIFLIYFHFNWATHFLAKKNEIKLHLAWFC